MPSSVDQMIYSVNGILLVGHVAICGRIVAICDVHADRDGYTGALGTQGGGGHD
jgi:hypothetical protein